MVPLPSRLGSKALSQNKNTQKEMHQLNNETINLFFSGSWNGVYWNSLEMHRGPHALWVDEVSLKMPTSRGCSEPSCVRFRGLTLNLAPLGHTRLSCHSSSPTARTTSCRLPWEGITSRHRTPALGWNRCEYGIFHPPRKAHGHTPDLGAPAALPVGEWAVRSLSASVAGVLHSLLRGSWVWWPRAPCCWVPGKHLK